MDPRLEQAFQAVPRRNFLPDDLADAEVADMPLPIGFGQTNSQPTTVAMMLSWLQVEPGNKILDVGSGSGWTTALLAHLTGKEGQVVAVEIVPELVEFGRQNCEQFGFRNIEFHQATTQLGWPLDAPYDRILVSAAAKRLPDELIEQLAPEGCLVIPVRHSVWVIEKEATGKVTEQEHPGFVFVPLV